MVLIQKRRGYKRLLYVANTPRDGISEYILDID